MEGGGERWVGRKEEKGWGRRMRGGRRIVDKRRESREEKGIEPRMVTVISVKFLSHLKSCCHPEVPVAL